MGKPALAADGAPWAQSFPQKKRSPTVTLSHASSLLLTPGTLLEGMLLRLTRRQNFFIDTAPSACEGTYGATP